jgi:hypothetical protein
MKQSVEASWGQITDEIQHDAININQYIWNQIQLKAYETSELEAFRNKDFYLVPIIRRNKLTGKLEIPPLIITRHSCPTPVYNQHVFIYDHTKKQVTWMWTIPTQYKHLHYLQNSKELLLDPLQRQQVELCIAYESGQLLDQVKRINKEHGPNQNMVMRPKESSYDG